MSCKDNQGNSCTHKVGLHLYSIAIPSIGALTTLRNAQRVYGKYGINIDMRSGQSLVLTAGQTSTLSSLDTSCKWDSSSLEQRQLYELSNPTATPNTIRVFYVQNIMQPDGSPLDGCAGHDINKPAVAIRAAAQIWTMAHEIGHVLLGSGYLPVHHALTSNLMCGAANTKHPPDLDTTQIAAIKRSPLCVPC